MFETFLLFLIILLFIKYRVKDNEAFKKKLVSKLKNLSIIFFMPYWAIITASLILFFTIGRVGSPFENVDKTNKDNLTLERELTKAISNSAWTNIDFDNNISTIIEFSDNNSLEIVSYSGIYGPKLLDLNGNWYVENDYLKIKYTNQDTYNNWTISNDFSSINNNLGVEYLLDKSKKVINLNLEELVSKYQLKNSKKITDYSKQQSSKDEMGPYNGLQKALKIIGNRFEGGCKVGNVYGSSIIKIDQNKVSVNYSALGYSETERGVLENLELKDDGENNTYRMSGNWNNQDGGDGIFRLEVYGADKPNTVYLAIDGSSWKYYSNIKLSDENFKKFIAIFLNKSKNNQTNNLETNKTLLPQSINYDGKPELEYTINNEIVALDSYDENDSERSYIRMKFNDKEVILKMQKQHSSKVRRVYSNSDYVATFDGIIYDKCAGEGAQYLTGKLLIQNSSDQNTVTFKGFDTIYSSKECQEMGNG